METKISGATSKGNLYEDIEPYCEWHKEEGQDTLHLHLNGFKKEQLKVQTNNKGILIVFGERHIDASRRSRFRKEIKLSNEYNANAIHARFSQGILSVIIPKNSDPLKKEAEKEINHNGPVKEATAVALEKGSIWGVKTSKRRAIKVAAVVAVVVMVVVLGTHIARLVHRHPHEVADDTKML